MSSLWFSGYYPSFFASLYVLYTNCNRLLDIYYLYIYLFSNKSTTADTGLSNLASVERRYIGRCSQTTEHSRCQQILWGSSARPTEHLQPRTDNTQSETLWKVFGRIIRDAAWIRKIGHMNRDDGSYQLSHVWDNIGLHTDVRRGRSDMMKISDRRLIRRLTIMFFGCLKVTNWYTADTLEWSWRPLGCLKRFELLYIVKHSTNLLTWRVARSLFGSWASCTYCSRQ